MAKYSLCVGLEEHKTSFHGYAKPIYSRNDLCKYG